MSAAQRRVAGEKVIIRNRRRNTNEMASEDQSEGSSIEDQRRMADSAGVAKVARWQHGMGASIGRRENEMKCLNDNETKESGRSGEESEIRRRRPAAAF